MEQYIGLDLPLERDGRFRCGRMANGFGAANAHPIREIAGRSGSASGAAERDARSWFRETGPLSALVSSIMNW